ncbi:homologous recombination OB-fold protein-like [Xyrauchen texanus]|uniref:homologous recombination OB-fold protein-like n=1 Tax=Xyrauchen texanus TaxID=154827 RepID=UPI002242A1AD|nr:homologous recombination OB-fold protein-like [Xyrauchen texanus]
MTVTACDAWKGLFSVGEEFDDEDLLEADWTCPSKPSSASTSAVAPSSSLRTSSEKSTLVQQSSVSSSSGPEESTLGSGYVAPLCTPACSPFKALRSLSIPGHQSLSSSVPSLRAPGSSLHPSSNHIHPPSTVSLSVLQRDPHPQDDFDDWDVDFEELVESIPPNVSQPQKNPALHPPLDRISPAKRMRPSASSGAGSMTAVAQILSPSHMCAPATAVSQFPRPVTPRPPVVSPQGQTSPPTLRTPLQSRGSLFHAVSSTPNPSPTLTPCPINAPILTNHLVQLVSAANKTPQRPQSGMIRTKTRRFPGPAGALPQQVSTQSLDDIVVSVPQTPTHGAVARLRSEVSNSQVSEEEEFIRGPWEVMKSEMGLNEKNPSCFLNSHSVVMVLRKAALRQLAKNKVPNMAVVLKRITHTHADAKAIFRDPTGEMQGTVHRRLLEDRQGELKTGAVLLLKQVGVFSPTHRNHYLNVTPNNLLRIYSPDGVLNNSQLSHPPLELALPTKPAGGPVSQMELHFDDEDDDENAVLKSVAGAGLQHTSEVSNELCQAPTGSGITVDTAWETDDLDELLGELPVESYGGVH